MWEDAAGFPIRRETDLAGGEQAHLDFCFESRVTWDLMLAGTKGMRQWWGR